MNTFFQFTCFLLLGFVEFGGLSRKVISVNIWVADTGEWTRAGQKEPPETAQRGRSGWFDDDPRV